jgi:phytoene dehydrogenase-like protein
VADYDVAVIGASCDGLVAGGLLAKRGKRVVVLEGRERAGGRCATVEFEPGYKVSPVLMATGRVHADVVRGLDLTRYGLEAEPIEPAATLLRPKGTAITLPAGHREGVAAAARISAADGQGYKRLSSLLDRVVPLLRGLLVQEPLPMTRPSVWDVLGRGGAPWRDAIRHAWRLRGLGEKDLMELLRIAPQSLKDFAEDWFTSEPLRALIVLPAMRGACLGPYSPGGVTNLLLWEALNHKRLGRGALYKGGLGALGLAVLRGAEAAGVSVRTNARVSQVKVESGRATGLVLEGGEELSAQCVIAAGDVRRALLNLVDPLDLGLTLRPRIEAFRSQGTVARVHFALDGLPPAPSGGDLGNFLQIGESLDELERAFDDAKYGRVSATPWLELVFPSIHDPSMAPAGKHVATTWVQHAPRTLRDGSWEQEREALGDRVQARIEDHLPGFGARVVAREVVTPVELEAEFGLSGGHVFGGEMAMDQLFTNRPVPACGRYSTPIPGLYLCGSGTHPGGHVGGASGRNAATRILREWSAIAALSK